MAGDWMALVKTKEGRRSERDRASGEGRGGAQQKEKEREGKKKLKQWEEAVAASGGTVGAGRARGGAAVGRGGRGCCF